jgi:hypothetical protein
LTDNIWYAIQYWQQAVENMMTKEVRNILKVYRQATQQEHDRGTKWYADAQAQAQAIANQQDVPLRVVVGVIAALSPNNRWERNVKDASDLIAAFLRGDPADVCRPSTYTKMRDKAWSVIEQMPDTDDDVMRILNGQKIVSFFCNIMGHDNCTIDGHAYNIARGKRVTLTDNDTNLNKSVYLEMQAAYQRAAKRVGIRVYELQAVTWVVWKRLHNI